MRGSRTGRQSGRAGRGLQVLWVGLLLSGAVVVWVLPNVPASAGLVRVRAMCVRGGTVQS